MSKFRKKPVVVEAMQWNGHDDESGIVAALLFMAPLDKLPHAPDDPHVDAGIGFTPADGRLYIPTLEGTMCASPGDWIIKGVNGEFYPCKPDIFAQTYEPDDAPDYRTLYEDECKHADRLAMMLESVFGYVDDRSMEFWQANALLAAHAERRKEKP